MRIAMVQLQVDAGNVNGNRLRGLALAEEAAAHADVVVLPELWTLGYALKEVSKWAETEQGATVLGLGKIASRYGVYIVAGSIPFRQKDIFLNTALVIGPEGMVVADYSKIHLFSAFREERYFQPGVKKTIFSLPELTGGLGICYDLRFPELFRALTMSGAQIIFLPAEWPDVRRDHWYHLIRARAIENQIYFCAVNCVGIHKNIRFFGQSMLIGPDGQVVAQGKIDSEEIIYGDVHLQEVMQIRQSMDVWGDRKEELYIL